MLKNQNYHTETLNSTLECQFTRLEPSEELVKRFQKNYNGWDISAILSKFSGMTLDKDESRELLKDIIDSSLQSITKTTLKTLDPQEIKCWSLIDSISVRLGRVPAVNRIALAAEIFEEIITGLEGKRIRIENFDLYVKDRNLYIKNAG